MVDEHSFRGSTYTHIPDCRKVAGHIGGRRNAITAELEKLRRAAVELIGGIDELEREGSADLGDNAAEVIRAMAAACFGPADIETETLKQSFEHASPLPMPPCERESWYGAGVRDTAHAIAMALDDRAEEISRNYPSEACELQTQAVRIRATVRR